MTMHGAGGGHSPFQAGFLPFHSGVSPGADVIHCLSSYFLYQYIVVVVEAALFCGQLHFSECWRALGLPPTLCSCPSFRCRAGGDKSAHAGFCVDNSPVVPDISTGLPTAAFVAVNRHQIGQRSPSHNDIQLLKTEQMRVPWADCSTGCTQGRAAW